MDDIADLDITVNGSERDENADVSFSNIPSTYDEGTVDNTDMTPSNTITVTFSKPVDLNVFQMAGEDTPNEVTILVTGIDSNGDEVRAILHKTGDEFIFDEGFPAVSEVKITVISASEESFTVGTDFLGCVHPGMLLIFQL